MKNLTILLCLTFSLQIHAQTKAEKQAAKEEKANLEYLSTKKLIDSGNFLFAADRAIPMGGGSLSMVTIFNQIKFEDANADIVLPYFGTVWGGGGYNHKAVIKFSGQVENYTIDFDDQKRKIQIKFDLKIGSEIHNVVFTTRRSGYTSVHVKSSGRSSITYDGYVKPVSDTQ